MRASGILMPVSSLPSEYGIGCFSEAAYHFVDCLKEAGQRYWQILPLGPTGYGDSPYQSFSAFAGNPYFIDPAQLEKDGLLLPEEYQTLDFGDDPEHVDYAKQYEQRFPVLRKAFERFAPDEAYEEFAAANAYWLDDYSLFMSIKKAHNGSSWTLWEKEIRMRDFGALQEYRAVEEKEIRFWKFLQYEFDKQWSCLKAYANENGIEIIGDIPIYVAMDSADSWADADLFQFDENRMPVSVAGCPPDAFAADGQLWGNPLYDWDYHEKTGYAWWIRRMRRCFELYDIVRVDHFRGFDEYYSIPANSPTAAAGSWQKGPGMNLFNALQRQFGPGHIIAEDLGYVTSSVRKLVKESGYPGMKVMEFAFDSREAGDYMPYNYPRDCVVYTGTHDNQTLLAWYDELSEPDRRQLNLYMDLDPADRTHMVWALIRLTMGTVADTAIVPMQDYLCLGSEARMNRPSTQGSNWQWRMKKGAFTRELAEKIRKYTQVYGRLSENAETE